MSTTIGTILCAEVKIRDPKDNSFWSIDSEEASFIRDAAAGVVTLSIRMKRPDSGSASGQILKPQDLLERNCVPLNGFGHSISGVSSQSPAQALQSYLKNSVGTNLEPCHKVIYGATMVERRELGLVGSENSNSSDVRVKLEPKLESATSIQPRLPTDPKALCAPQQVQEVKRAQIVTKQEAQCNGQTAEVASTSSKKTHEEDEQMDSLALSMSLQKARQCSGTQFHGSQKRGKFAGELKRLIPKRHFCNVMGCGKWKAGTTSLPDVWGGPGHRCVRHGARTTRCNVKDCGKHRIGSVGESDVWGSPGPRCVEHGARARRCNVIDCDRTKRGVIQHPDAWGPQGPRCATHGGPVPRCTVTNCHKIKNGVVWQADEWGAAGGRCFRHGGRPKGK